MMSYNASNSLLSPREGRAWRCPGQLPRRSEDHVSWFKKIHKSWPPGREKQYPGCAPQVERHLVLDTLRRPTHSSQNSRELAAEVRDMQLMALRHEITALVPDARQDPECTDVLTSSVYAHNEDADAVLRATQWLSLSNPQAAE